jgi:hypothetical protein
LCSGFKFLFSVSSFPSGFHKDIFEEIRQIAHNCSYRLISKEIKRLSFSFGGEDVPEKSDCIGATFSSGCDKSKIPPRGRNYILCVGITSSISEQFLVNRRF